MTPMEIGTSSEEKIPDLLLDIVFEDAEIIGRQACDHAVIWIIDRNVDQRQVGHRYERIALGE